MVGETRRDACHAYSAASDRYATPNSRRTAPLLRRSPVPVAASLRRGFAAADRGSCPISRRQATAPSLQPCRCLDDDVERLGVCVRDRDQDLVGPGRPNVPSASSRLAQDLDADDASAAARAGCSSRKPTTRLPARLASSRASARPDRPAPTIKMRSRLPPLSLRPPSGSARSARRDPGRTRCTALRR